MSVASNAVVQAGACIRAGSEPDPHTPAHAQAVRAGQRYLRVGGGRGEGVVLRVIRVGGDTCEARREDASGRRRTLELASLLAVDRAGAGIHFRYLGFAPGHFYTTHAVVLGDDPPAGVRVLCPEWHPARPLLVSASELPLLARTAGARLVCRAALGEREASAVRPHAFAPATAGTDTGPTPAEGDRASTVR